MQILSILEAVTDPRRDHLKEHSLECILYIAISAVISGAESWYEVSAFGKMKEDFFRSRIKNFRGVPSHDTFNRVFSLLNPQELEHGFRSWIQEICSQYKGIVSIDGKEIRGARGVKQDGSFAPLRMVSAWAAGNGVCLGQEKVSAKSNEIKAIPALVKALDLEGCTVTIDAIACQHDIIRSILQSKADYLICVKENQKGLYKTIKSWFDGIDAQGNKPDGHGHIPPTRYQSSYTEECSHGRKEKRLCQVYNNGVTAQVLGWEEANSVVCLTNTKTYLKEERTVTEKHYYITSLSLDSGKIMQAIRTHWSIENNLHWQLDVTFNEDGQKKTKNAAQNFSLISKVAMTQLKNSKRKGSMAMKRKLAGWDIEYLKELLDAEWQTGG
ncbi:ISAs1 family transposase [uncultured Parabacteroides sp.]|uniref:ISAs1 family transposase n=1 Tax=uncultured Parabacteroides sp. TaxID=512312 RepID=UPI002627A788|nr:ISAs1 family transposase [uncultured Parabacteroides sp.]